MPFIINPHGSKLLTFIPVMSRETLGHIFTETNESSDGPLRDERGAVRVARHRGQLRRGGGGGATHQPRQLGGLRVGVLRGRRHCDALRARRGTQLPGRVHHAHPRGRQEAAAVAGPAVRVPGARPPGARGGVAHPEQHGGAGEHFGGHPAGPRHAALQPRGAFSSTNQTKPKNKQASKQTSLSSCLFGYTKPNFHILHISGSLLGPLFISNERTNERTKAVSCLRMVVIATVGSANKQIVRRLPHMLRDLFRGGITP